MYENSFGKLSSHHTRQSMVKNEAEKNVWKLSVPQGPAGDYRLAQIDDTTALPREQFFWKPPVMLRLCARVTNSQVPGTWGFGFWNDPFSISMGMGGGTRRLPTLPNAAWFFFSSKQSYLSFRDDKQANGFLAQTFRSPKIPALLLTMGVLGIPILYWPRLAAQVRRRLSYVISEDSLPLGIDATQWHSYSLEWQNQGIVFKVNNQTYYTQISPNGPLGFVAWIDNQFLSFPPNGKLSYGTLANPKAVQFEIKQLAIERGKEQIINECGLKQN
jgi:hypothetical protein